MRVAIIPARGGSKRLPRKNIVDFGGKPIIAWPISAARETGLFDSVIVSTEDAEISDVARCAGADVMWRPDSLADDQATVAQVCHHVIARMVESGPPPVAFCCIYATAAFLTAQDLCESFWRLDGPPEADVVMGVSGYPIHPYKALQEVGGYLKPMWPNENSKKSQEFPSLVASNGTLYWARSQHFLREPSFFPERLVAYELPPDRAVDLDTPEDLAWARRLAHSGENQDEN